MKISINNPEYSISLFARQKKALEQQKSLFVIRIADYENKLTAAGSVMQTAGSVMQMARNVMQTAGSIMQTAVIIIQMARSVIQIAGNVMQMAGIIIQMIFQENKTPTKILFGLERIINLIEQIALYIVIFV